MSARTSGGRAAITYFSGTGNTRRACGLLAAALEREGWRVVLCEIAPPGREAAGDALPGDALAGAPPDLAVFAFPVFAFSVPHAMRRLFRRLPAVDGTTAAVIAVYGDDFSGPPEARRRVAGFEGGALEEAARLLARRGYAVRTSRSTGFPASFTQFMGPPEEAECRRLLAGSEADIAALAADLSVGRHALRRAGRWTRIWAGAVGAAFRAVGRRVLGKAYAVDERCTSCGWCERACPASTIRMRRSARSRKLPQWGWGCEACQRCINGCPEAAVQVSVLRLVSLIVAALPWGVLVARLVPWLAFPGGRILAWLAGTIVLVAAVDRLLRPLERLPALRRLAGRSYTRAFRRYRGPAAGS